MGKIGWLIYNREMSKINEGFIQAFMEEAEKLSIQLHLMVKEEIYYGVVQNELVVLHQGEKCHYPDFVIMRNNDPLLSQHFERLGMVVFNNSFVSSISNHKAKTHQFLAGKGVPMLDTIFVYRDEFSPKFLPFAFPVVVKEVAGKGGNEVFLCENGGELEALLQTSQSKELVIQKMGDVPGRDVRVFVVGNEIIAAVLRSSDSDFRANFSLGGSACIYELSDEERMLVHRVITQFDGGLGFVGIDFLFAKDGSFVFNEIEDVAGSRTLYANSNINIVKLYLEHIVKSI